MPTTLAPFKPLPRGIDLTFRSETKTISGRQLHDGTFSSIRELIGLNFLISPEVGNIKPLINQLLTSVMAMDTRNNIGASPFSLDGPTRYSALDEKGKEGARLLKKNKEVVEICLHTLFQWFGTGVGKAYLKQLSDLINDDELMSQCYNEWPKKGIFCPNCQKSFGKKFDEMPVESVITCDSCFIDYYPTGIKAGTHRNGKSFPAVLGS